jgi:thiamine biosynthesis lipoprotein ApbE
MQNIPEEALMEKEATLAAEVEGLLPHFVNSCRDQAAVVIIHQDSFAADYQDDEYVLLGKAIKFAELHGKEVHIVGKNRETLKGASKPELLQ